MQLLVTGAFGELGQVLIRAALERGHRVTGFDLPRVRNRVAARRLGRLARDGAGLAVRWGDIRDADAVSRAVEGQDAVFHGAAILAPASEAVPEVARKVNVQGTRHVLAALQAEAGRRAAAATGARAGAAAGRGAGQGAGQGDGQGAGQGATPPLVLYPSSVSAYGPGDPEGPPRRVTDPLRPTDGYTGHKAECEARVREAGLPFVIFRVGVALAPSSVRMSGDILRTLLSTRPENRMEIIHPRDVATAILEAAERPEAWHRTFNLGGGVACQIRQRDLLGVAFGAVGLGRLPEARLGRRPYYTDWMDTQASERLLHYQRYTFDDYRREAYRRYRVLRAALRPAGPLLRWALLRAYGPRGGQAGADGPRDRDHGKDRA